MPPKKKKSDFVNYEYDNTQIAIRESRNLARWNPSLAIYTMERTALRLVSEVEETLYNNAVNHINETIKSIMNKSYYIKQDYWGDNHPKLLNEEHNFG